MASANTTNGSQLIKNPVARLWVNGSMFKWTMSSYLMVLCFLRSPASPLRKSYQKRSWLFFQEIRFIVAIGLKKEVLATTHAKGTQSSCYNPEWVLKQLDLFRLLWFGWILVAWCNADGDGSSVTPWPPGTNNNGILSRVWCIQQLTRYQAAHIIRDLTHIFWCVADMSAVPGFAQATA